MRTILLAVLLLVSSVSHAQQQLSKPVLCGEPKQVLEAFQGDRYREVVRWTGKDIKNEDHIYIVLSNFNTGTFTILEVWDKAACVLGAGTGSTFFTGKAETGV